VDLFCGPNHEYGTEDCPEFSTSVGRIVPANEDTADAFEAPEREEAETRAAEQRVDTAREEARAVEELNAALANAGDDYVLLQMVQACVEKPEACPAFWIVPQGQDVNITTPAP
jgi:hypothetical protein